MLSSNVLSGRVVGRFAVGVVDGVDEDDEPDLIPARGTVTFTASVPYLPNVAASPPITILGSPRVAVLDEEGYVCTPNPANPSVAGKRGMRLEATDDPGAGVTGWTWNATYRFTDAKGSPLMVSIPTFAFELPAGEERDLTRVVKIPSSKGIGVERAEALADMAAAAALSSADSAEVAVAVAQDVKRRADAGEFQGAGGERGPAGPNTVPTQEAVAEYVAEAGNPVNVAITEVASKKIIPPAYERRRDGLESFDAGKLVKWRTAFGKVRAGTADAKLLCVGDSTTQGLLGSANGGITNSYPYRLARFLDDAGLNASRGLSVPGSTNNEDSRYTLEAGWSRSQTSFLGFGGTSLYHFSGATQSNIAYKDPALADRYDIYYLRGTSNGTFAASATGGESVSQSAKTASGVGKVTISAGAAATNNVLTITSATDGDTWIIGIEPWLSTRKQVHVGNAGVGSSRAATHWGGTDARGSSSAIKAYAPDLTIISLGVNDGSSNHTLEQFSAAMDNLIAAAQVTGDVILMAPIPVGDTWPNQTTKTMVPVYTAWMRARGLPFYNLPSRWNNGNDAFARGWMLDGVHPNQHGYEDLARGFIPGLLGGLTWLP